MQSSTVTVANPDSAEAATIIVVGFEPFDQRSRNRSWEVVQRLPPRPGLDTVMLPVNFSRIREAVRGLLERRPRALLLIGEARRDVVSVEQLALNILDSDRPDNAGRFAQSESVVPGAPLTLWAPWDGHALMKKMKAAGIPAGVSFHAGTYACNAALYLALQTAQPPTQVGFLHVPNHRWPFGPRLALLQRAADLGIEALLTKKTQQTI